MNSKQTQVTKAHTTNTMEIHNKSI